MTTNYTQISTHDMHVLVNLTYLRRGSRSGMRELQVQTTYGTVQGELLHDASVWKGIPYAKPPVGEPAFQGSGTARVMGWNQTGQSIWT